MIEINCDGGRVGRFWWRNSSFGGTFMRCGQFNTVLNPGRCGWDHDWPECHAWPIRPWGKGDEADGAWRDFAAFESWFQSELTRRDLDEIDFTITQKIEIYAMMTNMFYYGIDAGQDPWRWARQLEQQAASEADR